MPIGIHNNSNRRNSYAEDNIKYKIVSNRTSDEYLSEAESKRMVEVYLKLKSKYIPGIRYDKPETFAFFGSAEKYYNDTITEIYTGYPYDGSRAEKLEWAYSASYLDIYFLEHEYPKSTGFISLDRTNDTSADTQYGTTTAPKYVKFFGGPQIGTVYDSENNRQGNLRIDGTPGNTIEFWMKKNASTFFGSQKREVIFDISSIGENSNPSTGNNYGRMTLELFQPSSPSETPFRLVHRSGTTGTTTGAATSNGQPLGDDSVTVTSVADGKWHHYAVSMQTSGSNTVYKFYVDGRINDIRTAAYTIDTVNTQMSGTIGALSSPTTIDGSGSIGAGALSGSIDEFRFWKKARSEKEIGRFWYSPVHGGTDKDHTNAALGLYYKFNEGMMGQQSHDSVVLDYSGRINNGTIINWDSSIRSTDSAISLSENVPEENYKEVGDPIVNSANTLVQDVVAKFKTIGKSYDGGNMASLRNSVPSFLIDTDQEESFINLLQIMGSSLDDIYLKIKNLPKIKDFAYQEMFNESGTYKNMASNNFLLGCDNDRSYKFTGNHSKPWANRILSHFGLTTTEIFPDASLFEMFYENAEQLKFEHSLVEVRNTILSNIHKNLVHIFKKKGTESAFRNLMRCFGVDTDLVKINAYASQDELEIDLRPVYGTNKIKSLNFEGQNFQATVHNTSSGASSELGFIEGEASKHPITLAANIIFPNIMTPRQGLVEVQRTSLFGMHSVLGVGSDPLTWAPQDSGSFQVYFNKHSRDREDGYFELSSSAGVITALTSSERLDVYDGSNWNLALRIGNRTGLDFQKVNPGAGSEYLVELVGHCYETDTLVDSFHISSSIPEAVYQKISTQNKAVYLGSHKTNFTGSHLDSTDIKALSIAGWRDILKDEELVQHAQNASFYGRKNPSQVSDFDSGENMKSSDALLFRWQFENLTSSNPSGQLNVADASQQSTTEGTTSHIYSATGTGFVNSQTSIQQEFLGTVYYEPIDNAINSTAVKTKQLEHSVFKANTKPINYFYSFEKSMYQIISSEMINMFAGLVGYNNLIGEPVNKYRTEYKSLQKLREKFFRNINNDVDLDKFVEYYRWIDHSLSNFLRQLVPATSDFNSDIQNIVESHILERNKYRHIFPNMRIENDVISARTVSISEADFTWEKPPEWFENQEENSIDFSQQGAIEVDHSADLVHHSSPDRPFAISLWTKANSTTGGAQTLLVKPDEYEVKITDDDIHFVLFSDAGSYVAVTGANKITTDWNSIVVTYDGTLDDGSPSAVPQKIYFNGVESSISVNASGTYNGMSGTLANMIIGASDTSGTNNFDGLMADIVMVTGAVLTSAQALEFYQGGRNYDITAHSRYSDVLAWWKMGDDSDTESGAGSIQDYVGSNDGTPVSGTLLNRDLIIYRHPRDPDPTDVRKQLLATISKDIPGLMSSERWKTKPYKLTSQNPVTVARRINKDKHNPVQAVPSINRGETITVTTNDVLETDTRIDSKFPFTFTKVEGTSTTDDFKEQFTIGNNHIPIDISLEASLKSPWTEGKVGAKPHNNTHFLTPKQDRPEAYELEFSANSLAVKPTPINKAKSMFFADVPGTRFMTIKNYKPDSTFKTAGNYSKLYETILVTSRGASNKYYIDNDGDWIKANATQSPYLTDIVDFLVPDRGRSEHVITSRFNAIGGPELQQLTLDRETEEFTAYNSMNYRNLMVRKALDILSSEPSEQFGFRSGSAVTGSIHKINRNTKRYFVGSEEVAKKDSLFVQRPIPQSDYQYSWVTATVGDTVSDFVKRNNNMSYVSNFGLSHKEYVKDFSLEATGTIPSGWQTNYSQKTSSYTDLVNTAQIFVTASSGSLPAVATPVVADGNLLFFDHTIYRSSSSGFVFETALNTATGSGDIINSVSISDDAGLAALGYHPGGLSFRPIIDIYKSSSLSGWALDERLSTAFDQARTGYYPTYAFFSGSSLVYLDATAVAAPLADSTNSKGVKWATSSSLSGWTINSSSSPLSSNILGSTSTENTSTGMTAFCKQTGRAVVASSTTSNLLIIEYNHTSSEWEVLRSWSSGLSREYRSLAISEDDIVAVGLPQKVSNTTGQKGPSGKVALYWSGSSTAVDIESPYKDHLDRFGSSVSFSGSYLAIGSPEYDISTSTEERVYVENDTGAAYVYKTLTGSQDIYLEQVLYGRKETPLKYASFGKSLYFADYALVIESPGERTGTWYSDATELDTTVDLFYFSASATPTDKSLQGPIITGSSSQKSFSFVGKESFSPEISQLPEQFREKTGNLFRVIETSSEISTTQDEFFISFSILEGSDSVSDKSNSIHGLTSTPDRGEILVVQYKLSSGNWETVNVIEGSSQTGTTRQNEFVEYYSAPITNEGVSNIQIRILSNSDSLNRHLWSVKNIKIRNSHSTNKSSEKLIKTTHFRRDLFRNNNKNIKSLNFWDPTHNTLANSGGSSGAGGQSFSNPNRSTGVHDEALSWTVSGSSSDRPRSLSLWLNVREEDHQTGQETFILSYGPQFGAPYAKLVMRFKVVIDASGFKLRYILRDAATNEYTVTTSQILKYGNWYHVCVTYDGLGTASVDGLKIYVNGLKADTETDRDSSSYSYMQNWDTSKNSVWMLGKASMPPSDADGLSGRVSNFSLFNKELTSSEVLDLSNAAALIDENYSILKDPLGITSLSTGANLIAHWTFNGSNQVTFIANGTHNYTSYIDIIGNYELYAQSNVQTDTGFNSGIYSFAPVVQDEEIVNIYWDLQDERSINNFTTLSNEQSPGYLKNTISPYTFSTLQQIRAGESLQAKSQKKNNKLTISVRGKEEIFPSVAQHYYHDTNPEESDTQDNTAYTDPRQVEVYDEVMLTTRYKPLELTILNFANENLVEATQDGAARIPQSVMEDLWTNKISMAEAFVRDEGITDSRIVTVITSNGNDLTKFSNADLNRRLFMREYGQTKNIEIIQGLADLARRESRILEVCYEEVLYPKEVNTFTNRARTRINFDYYSWKTNRADRSTTLGSSNQYSNCLVEVAGAKYFPEITSDNKENKKTNGFEVDSVDIKNRFTDSPNRKAISTSKWPLDSRENFNELPISIQDSYFASADSFLQNRPQASKKEGVLQNDYNIFGLGFNGLYGTPPVAPIYSRRVPQLSGSVEYLAGEARWQAPEQADSAPFISSDETTENLRRGWQDHSLVAEYKVSDHVEEIVLNNKSDFKKTRNFSNFLSLTGAVYHTSSQTVAVGSKFFDTYATSEFMKYFDGVMEEVKENNLGGAAQLTLKCNAAIKFTPYEGFYPAERTLQIGEIFSRGYMSDYSIDDIRSNASDRNMVKDPGKVISRKIKANLQQSLKPLMAPGVLYNSIKSGVAVDYPIFSGDATTDTVLSTFNTNIKSRLEPYTGFDSSLSSLKMFTGSLVNSTLDSGVPRLSGSVIRRVTFEDLLEPQRLISTKIYDNEPHPSASIFYGNSATTKVYDYPFQFGSLNSENNETKIFADNFSLTKRLDDTLTPYKMAINNFCAETVNFFLEGQKVAALESDQVNPHFNSGSMYKMRVHLKNDSLTMYDRHSAFGPAVDEGAGLVKTQITGSLTTLPGDVGLLSLGQPRNEATNDSSFAITSSAGDVLLVEFKTGAPGGYSDITTGAIGPNLDAAYDVSAYGKIYAVSSISDNKAYIDINEIVGSTFAASSNSINRLVQAAINYHRWNGNELELEAIFGNDDNIIVRQVTTGSAGNTTVTKQGSIDVIMPNLEVSFSGGTNQSTSLTGISQVFVTESSSHEYAPFVPPFLDKDSEPYVEVTFHPDETRNYTIEEILESSTYDYKNFKEVPSNHQSNTNYKEAMSISASLDLRNFIAYKNPDSSDPGTSLEQRKRWVIQTKWETPLLNFRDTTTDALDMSTLTTTSVTGSPWQTRTWNNYLTTSVVKAPQTLLTASTGMWHQYGQLPTSQEGYSISIEKIEGLASEKQLAKKVGFIGEDLQPVRASTGRIAERKEVSEGVVAIPFYVDQENSSIKFFTARSNVLRSARKINRDQDKKYLDRVRGLGKDSEEYNSAKEEYLDFFNLPGTTAKESVAYQLRMMKKFVFPAQFDYYTNPTLPVKPIMYVFQFNAEFTREDLSNIWQNLSPQSIKSGARPRNSSVDNPSLIGVRQDVMYVSNLLTNKNIPWKEKSEFFTNDVRWMMFKVKQRARADLAEVKLDSLPGAQRGLEVDLARTSIKPSKYLSDKKYSYNWPYDYFSIVELIKMNGKVNFLPFGQGGNI